MQNSAANHHDNALRLASAGRLEEALEEFQQAIVLEPGNSVIHFNFGFACHQLGRLVDATQAYARAVELSPEFFDAWLNLAAALKTAHEPQAAVVAAQTAVSLRPNSPAAQLNLGNALKARGDISGAQAAYKQATVLEPQNPRHWLNLANLLRDCGNLGDALPLFQKAVAIAPNFAEAHRDLAFALFITGDLQAGWEENEWRWTTDEMSRKRRSFERPRWEGESIQGKTLLIYTEQGSGDAIQFARYATLAADWGARVVLECPAELARLLGTVRGVVKVIARGEPLPAFDYHAALLSLPRIFRTSLATVPREVPYVAVLPQARLAAASVLGGRPSNKRRIGLVWAGNPAHVNDRNRSLPAEALVPLLLQEGMEFYSLQMGSCALDWDRLRGPGKSSLNLTQNVHDFADTAGVIDQLDLVISVDTSVAHLAGALGRPVWLFLPYAPDWRWLLQREDSPWYPTMRLFRQHRPGDWHSVVQMAITRLTSGE